MKEDSQKRVLSCIQPTGEMHFGNYFGAISNWVELQKKYDCRYAVVDYHAMTMPYNAKKLRQNSWELVFTLLASGIKKENLFVQSLVPEHTELCWILGCCTSYGELSRMTQFKDKSVQVKGSNKDDFVSAGLFGYPILQAADILIYRADYVPIGKDQEQHLELSRNIANRFNKQFRTEYFKLPEALFTEIPKVQSLANPLKKMSKSLGEKHYVALLDDDNRISKKVRSAVTDTGERSAEMSPGVKNLFGLLKAAGKKKQHTELLAAYNEDRLSYKDLKDAVAEGLIEISSEIREKRKELLEDKKKVKKEILESAEEIRKEAKKTLKDVRELTGLFNLK